MFLSIHDLSKTTTDAYLTARQRARERQQFERVRRAEVNYSLQLRRIARHVGEMVKGFDPTDQNSVNELLNLLQSYATALTPWAKKQAERMIVEVARRDAQAWFKTAQIMGVELRREIEATPIGDIVRRIQQEQVHLIRSIPLEAAERAQTLTREMLSGGRRAAELVPMIMNSGNVTISRANLIARTEVGKAHSALTQARAEFIGSPGYVWRTVKDPFVRKMHKRLEGTVHQWDDPPIAEESGVRHSPGNFPGCRCYAEPIIPDLT